MRGAGLVALVGLAGQADPTDAPGGGKTKGDGNDEGQTQGKGGGKTNVHGDRDRPADPGAVAPPEADRAKHPDAPTAVEPPEDPKTAARNERARKLLEEAIRRREEESKTGRETPGVKVDKYFGTKLPPVCARLGCYITDDGKRFYCVNPSCQKHKKRETKHSRRGRPSTRRFVYFRCPRCESKRVEMNVFANEYHCKTCKHTWQR